MHYNIYFCIFSLRCTPKKRISLKENTKNILPEFRHLLEPSYEPSRKSCLLGSERREDGAETRTGCNGWWVGDVGDDDDGDDGDNDDDTQAEIFCSFGGLPKYPFLGKELLVACNGWSFTFHTSDDV